ncbi:hypothetical protein T439DRAFT_382572 [Meredithblackwellia eburnea MCA 4105]
MSPTHLTAPTIRRVPSCPTSPSLSPTLSHSLAISRNPSSFSDMDVFTDAGSAYAPSSPPPLPSSPVAEASGSEEMRFGGTLGVPGARVADGEVVNRDDGSAVEKDEKKKKKKLRGILLPSSSSGEGINMSTTTLVDDIDSVPSTSSDAKPCTTSRITFPTTTTTTTPHPFPPPITSCPSSSSSTPSSDSIWSPYYASALTRRRLADNLASLVDRAPYFTAHPVIPDQHRRAIASSSDERSERCTYTASGTSGSLFGGASLGGGSGFFGGSRDRERSRGRSEAAVSRVATRETGVTTSTTSFPSSGGAGRGSAGPGDGEEGMEGRPWWRRALARNRRKCRMIMRLKRFHLIMIGLVGFDLPLLTASCPTEETYEWLVHSIVADGSHYRPSDFACTLAPTGSREAIELAIFGINISLLSIFTLEVFTAIFAFGPITYCSSWVCVLDGFVVIVTLCLDTYFHLSKNPAAKSPVALVILRLWKIFRAVHAIAHALELHYEEVVEHAERGRDLLEWERIAESLRLSYVRQTLLKTTGSDISPHLVESYVQREVSKLRAKAERAEMERLLLMEDQVEKCGKGKKVWDWMRIKLPVGRDVDVEERGEHHHHQEERTG